MPNALAQVIIVAYVLSAAWFMTWMFWDEGNYERHRQSLLFVTFCAAFGTYVLYRAAGYSLLDSFVPGLWFFATSVIVPLAVLLVQMWWVLWQTRTQEREQRDA